MEGSARESLHTGEWRGIGTGSRIQILFITFTNRIMTVKVGLSYATDKINLRLQNLKSRLPST